MTEQNDNKQDDSFAHYKRKPRYIIIYEDCFEQLSPATLKIYMAMRFDADYSSDCSPIKRNVKFLMNRTNLPRRQVFYSFKELEDCGLLKREINPGFQSIYWVAQDMGYFLPKEAEQPQKQPEPEQKPVDLPPVQDTHGVVQDTHGVVQDTHYIINNSLQQSSHIKPIVDSESTSGEKEYRKDLLFMAFYSIYPQKQKPSIARKTFYKVLKHMNMTTEEFSAMIVADVLQRIENNWHGRDKNKIPFPATYLNTREWEGEITAPSTNIAEFKAKPKYKTMDDIMAGVL